MKIPGYYLFFMVLVTGASVLVIEILGARMISPHFGVSLYVWSSLIAVTLISLAVGYWRGGVMADSSPQGGRLLGIIFECALILAVIPFVRVFVLSGMGQMGLRMGALMSAFVLFSLPLMLLGMATPFAVRLAAREIGHVGRTTGMLYAVSTVGSFFGAVITGFFLIPLFNVDKIIYLVSASLSLLVLFPWVFTRRPVRALLAGALAAACIFMMIRPSQLPRKGQYGVLYRAESPYGEVRVVEDGETRSLVLSGVVQGRMDSSGKTLERYPVFVDSVFRALRPGAKDVLMLGLGAGVMHKVLEGRGMKVDSVEIDPVVVEAARRFFGYESEGGSLHIGDGRYFLNSTASRYDCVFLDAYAAEALPYHLFSRESFVSVKSVLRPGGILAINFHDFADPRKAESTRAVLRTLDAVFENVSVFEVVPWHDGRFSNMVFLATDGMLSGGSSDAHLPKPLDIGFTGEDAILTDGYNPIAILYNPVAESMKEAGRRTFPKEILLD